MSQLVEEVKSWNTPLIGSYLLWRFTQGYCENHPHGEAPIGLLHFLASAILTNKKLSEPVSNQRKNLQSYVRSFESSNNSDILLTVQERIKEKREYTLAAIDVCLAEGLVVWDLETGKLYPHELKRQKIKGRSLKDSVKKIGDKAEILGKWFSEHSLSAIGTYFKVVF